MTAQQPPHEKSDKGAENDIDRDTRTRMERFRDLARGLVNVPRDEYKEEEERYALQNAARKNDKKSNDT